MFFLSCEPRELKRYGGLPLQEYLKYCMLPQCVGVGMLSGVEGVMALCSLLYTWNAAFPAFFP